MQDRLEAAPAPRVREDPFAHALAVEAALGVEHVGPESLATWASAGRPGSTTSRAMTSVSMTGTPSAAKRSATVDLPLAMPPVSATRKGAGLIEHSGWSAGAQRSSPVSDR